MIWTKEQAKALTDRALSFSKAEADVRRASTAASARTCASRATRRRPPARRRATSLAITSSFGKRSGTVTTAQFDDASLQRALRNAEEIAKAVAGESRGDAVSRAADVLAGRRRTSTTRRRRRPSGARRRSRRRSRSARRRTSSRPASSRRSRRCRRSRARKGCSPTTASRRPTTTSRRARRTDRAPAGRRSPSTSCGCCSPATLAETAIDKAAMAKNPIGHRAGEVHRRPRAGRARRPARVHALLRRRAPGGRRAQLLLEEGRRQSRRRADRRRQGPHLLGSGASARADASRSTTKGCRSRRTSGSRTAS